MVFEVGEVYGIFCLENIENQTTSATKIKITAGARTV
jgi:hypothetical protein